MYRVEMSRALRRWRTWVIAAVLVAMPTLFTIVIAVSPPPSGEGPPLTSLALRSGFFAGVIGLVLTQFFLLPMTASIIGGDAISSDASHGMLRYLLIRPVGRMRLLLAKYAAAMTALAIEVLAIVVAGLVVGGIFLGLGSIPTLSGTTLGPLEAMLRLVGSMTYVIIGLAPIAAIGVFASTLTDSSPGAIGATLGFYIVEQILLGIPNLSSIHPYLLGQDGLAFTDLFRAPVAWKSMTHGATVALVYTVVFVGLALLRFGRKDITS